MHPPTARSPGDPSTAPRIGAVGHPECRIIAALRTSLTYQINTGASEFIRLHEQAVNP